MGYVEWDVGVLVFGEQDYFVVVGDFGSVVDYDLVFGVVVVYLQVQCGIGFDCDVFDLEMGVVVDGVVCILWVVDFVVCSGFVVVVVFDLVDDFFDVLYVVFVVYEYGVVGFYDYYIFQFDYCDQVGVVGIVVVVVQCDDVVVVGIVVGVFV